MKYSKYIAIFSAIILIIACFMPWAYYPDIQKNFTGLFSENNIYGRPGKVFIFLSIVIIMLTIIPRVWAKRANQFVAVLTVAYAIKTLVLFAACYRGICPEKKMGLWLVVICCIVMLVATMLPDFSLKDRSISKKSTLK